MVNDNHRTFNDFIVLHPSGANRRIISRNFRNCNFGTFVNSFAQVIFKVEVAEVVGFDHPGIDIQSCSNLGEVFAPTIETETFANRIGRGHGGSIDGNELAVNEITLDIEPYREALSNFFILSRVGRVFDRISKFRAPHTSELVCGSFRFEVGRSCRLIFFVIVEDRETLFEELLAQFLTEAGHEGDFEQFVQHGIVGHSTSIESLLSRIRSHHVAMIVLPAAEHGARDRRIINFHFDNIAIRGPRFENNFTFNNKRNLVVASGAREVKHRVIAIFKEPDKRVADCVILSIQDFDKVIVRIHVSRRLANNSRNRRIGGRINSLLHIRQLFGIIVAVFDCRKRRIRINILFLIVYINNTIVFHQTNNTAHGGTRNMLCRTERIQHDSRVVARLILIIVIETVITDNATGNATRNRAIVAAVIDSAILIFANNTARISGTRNGTLVQANSDTARNVRDVGLNSSIVRTTHDTACNGTRNRAIVNARADSTRVRTGNTTNQILANNRGVVFTMKHRAIATVTTGNTTNTTHRLRILRGIDLNRVRRFGIFNNAIVQTDNCARILRSCSHLGIANRKILDDTLLADYAEKARIRVLVATTLTGSPKITGIRHILSVLDNIKPRNRLSVAIEDAFESLVLGLTDRLEFRIIAINVLCQDIIGNRAVCSPSADIFQVRALRDLVIFFAKDSCCIRLSDSEGIRCHGETETNCCCKYFFHNEPFLVGDLV